MPQYFLDSSALVKRYRYEIGATWLGELFVATNRLVVSRLGHIEVAAAIVRRGGASNRSSPMVELALVALEQDMKDWFQVTEFSDEIPGRAIQLIRAHGLRAADAIQIASALLAKYDSSRESNFYFVSADDELNVAAAAEGLQVENPNFHP